MSAESPRRGVHRGAQVISPQPVVDRTIIDNVAEIINDIVPQGYAGIPNSDNKEIISWARFEYADINDPVFYPDHNEGFSTAPLLLVLGYTNGVQVWLIPATGEATEVLSLRQGVVRTLRILPNPKTDDEHVDPFGPKRPLVAICDSTGPGPQFCNISFISLKTGEQAKTIKFKNPVCDILANKRSVVVTFVEKIAVFDARTLEDILTVTTCYASPGPNPNPIALGTRWLAYSDKKLLPSRRSSGGCEGEGVQSYTATVLHAGKSLCKGLRELGETVASSLTGTTVSPIAINNTDCDTTQSGVVTILDLQAAKEEKELDDSNIETVIAHFTAHSDAIVAMTFDSTGALLMTADKKAHNFHVFRIHPHPCGPTLASVHHLYILHRGETTGKVQDMIFSSDSRWAAVSTGRGTTHVFPITPYGGSVGMRTHSTPHVVNKLSRFHRSAGLTDDTTRSHSPVSHTELSSSVYPYSNPRLPPYPQPTRLHPLSQIRQTSPTNTNNSSQPRPQQRQRLCSDDNGISPICACFAPPRAWLFAQRESNNKVTKKAVDCLFIMACHGNLTQYDLEPKAVAGVSKVCNDTMIALDAEARGQWSLLRSPNSSEIIPPLSLSSPLLSVSIVPRNNEELDARAEDRWLSQVEIVTHAGPHRRLWMGPQFAFKTYNAPSGSAVNISEAEPIEIGATGGSRPARSNPVNMPHAASRPLMPVVIDGSGSSYEQSPRFMEAYGDLLDSENVGISGSGESQLREDLAEAMLETSIAPHRAPWRRSVFERVGQPVTKVVNPLGTVITVSADEEDVNFAQEFDIAEGSLVPGPPRSVCAEEGPASLSDLEPESQTLRELTEICAEMRLASEPAIDSVSDENICELKECKTVCAEMALGSTSFSIDFEKEEDFRDVPTSLNLCAEEGEIPNSPMTQAKEIIWYKNPEKTDNNNSQKENIAKAKYVVFSYSDYSVIVRNKETAHESNIESSSTEKSSSPPQMPNLSRVLPARKSADPLKKEGDDSESTQKESNIGKNNLTDIPKVGKEKSKATVHKSKLKTYATHYYQESSSESSDEHRITLEDKNPKNIKEEAKALVELRVLESKVGVKPIIEKSPKSLGEVETKELPTDKNLQLDTSSQEEDSGSSGFCVVDPGRDTSGSTYSDDDMEHIYHSQVPHIRKNKHSCSKDLSSDTTSSSDVETKCNRDKIPQSLECVQSVEPSSSSSHADATVKSASVKMGKDDSEKHSNITSFEKDLEKMKYLEILDLKPKVMSHKVDISRKSPLTVESTQEVCSPSMQQPQKSRSSKAHKDIEGNVSTANVNVTYNPMQELWVKTTVEDAVNTVDKTEGTSPSPTRRTKSRTVLLKTSSLLPKRSQDIVEIIDIDAMQKAEMETAADVAVAPECKILPSGSHDTSATRIKKYRKSKKMYLEEQSQNISTDHSPPLRSSKVKLAELQEAVDEIYSMESKWQALKAQDPPAETSWSSIVKKISPSSNLEIQKETDLQPLIETEERPEEYIKKLNIVESSESYTKNPTSTSAGYTPINEAAQRVSTKDLGEDTMLEKILSLDLSASLPYADEESPHDKDVTRKIAGQTKIRDEEDISCETKEDSFLAEVPGGDKRIVDEARRGNEAEKKESSLQLPWQVEDISERTLKEDIELSTNLTSLKEVLSGIKIPGSEKKSKLKEEAVPERLLSSSEEPNVAVVHSGESSQPSALSVTEKTKSVKVPSIANTGKKANKSKKKKRR